MDIVDFIKRKSKPTQPEQGCFYWVVGTDDEESKLWFAPDDNPDNLMLLNVGENKLTDEQIEEIINKMKSKPFEVKWKVIE